MNLPKTIFELKKWMQENDLEFDTFSIDENLIHEGFGIDTLGELYTWYYTERGKRENLKYFLTEEEIVAYAHQEIKKSIPKKD